MATIPVVDDDDEKLEELEKKFTNSEGVIDFGNDVSSLEKYINNLK